MTTSHQLSSKVTNFYSRQKWATHGLKKVVDNVAKLLNVESKRKFQPLEKTTSLKHTANHIVTICSMLNQRESFSRSRKPQAQNLPPTTLSRLVQGHCHDSVHVHRDAQENHQHHGTCCRQAFGQHRGKK